MSLVNHGIALAYVPDFVAKSHNLIAINVVDYAYLNQEKIELIVKILAEHSPVTCQLTSQLFHAG